MPLPARQFFGKPAFFHDVRAVMNTNRGMFAGSDQGWQYACMDASFYRFEVLRRAANVAFTTAATAPALGTDVRVVANGQIFGSTRIAYVNCTSPCTVPWHGEIVVNGQTQAGTPSSAAKFRYFAQRKGRGPLAFEVAKGDPSGASANPAIDNAVGSLWPLLTGGVAASAAALGSWVKSGEGKIIYGVHRTEEVVFVLAQPNGIATAKDALTVIQELKAMGVSDAVMGDGATSVTLVVDAHVDVAPIAFKDNSIPTGLLFRLQTLSLQTSAALDTRTDLTTDPRFSNAPRITGTVATVSLTNQGTEIAIADLGSGPGFTSVQLASALGISYPLVLKGPSSLLTVGVGFAAGGGAVNAPLFLQPAVGSDGTLVGTLAFTTAQGLVVFNVNWPLKT